jgi:hypothetical protein
VRSNDGAYDVDLSDANLPVSGNVSASVNHLWGTVPLPETPEMTMHTCTYSVWMSVLRRLHNGDGAVVADWTHTTFYFDSET